MVSAEFHVTHGKSQHEELQSTTYTFSEEKKEIDNETKGQPSESATRNNSCLKHWFSKRQGICEEPIACVSEDVEVNWGCDFLVPKQW